MASIKLIEPAVIKNDGSITIPKQLSDHIEQGLVLSVYVKSKKKIEIIGIDIKNGTRVVDVLILVNTAFVNQGFASITALFKEKADFEIMWTTGFCIPDDGDAKVDGCTWEGIVSIPDTVSDEDMKQMIMDINLDYDERVILGNNIHEVMVT